MSKSKKPTLKNYMSYDEISLSSMCGISSPTTFINNGDRYYSYWTVNSDTVCEDLLTSYGTDVGYVCLWRQSGGTIRVQYGASTSSGYYLDSINLWIGCSDDGYPVNSWDYPAFWNFPIQCNFSSSKSYYTFDVYTSYLPHYDNECDGVSSCNYCDDTIPLYVVAHAKVKTSSGYLKNSFRDGDIVYDYNGVRARRGEISLDVDCCS